MFRKNKKEKMVITIRREEVFINYVKGCPVGKFSAGGGSSALSLQCDPCPAGSFAASIGTHVHASMCTMCLFL